MIMTEGKELKDHSHGEENAVNEEQMKQMAGD